MAWSEWVGHRKENEQSTYIDYQITFIAATGEARPASGATYSTVIGSGSLPSTGLVAEPKAFYVSKTKKIDSVTDAISVVFRGYKVEA